MEHRGYLRKADKQYLVTKRGWECLMHFDIKQADYENIRRPLARQCLDWSVRRPHLAGQLGADLLKITIQIKWFSKFRFSRELVVTEKGRREMYELLGVSL